MHAVPDTFEHPLDAAEFKRPRTAPAWSCTARHIVRHAFEPHTHEAYGLGAIEAGVERSATAARSTLHRPTRWCADEPRRAAHRPRRDRRRLLPHGYLDAPLLEELSGERGWWFAEAVAATPPARRRTTRLLRQLWHATSRSPSMRCCRIWSTSCARWRGAPPRRATALPLRAGDRADARVQPSVSRWRSWPAWRALAPSTSSASSSAPTTPAAADADGAAPVRGQTAARRRRRAGRWRQPWATTDQAHLTRAAQRTGVTPARYQQQLGTRPRRDP